MDKRNRLKYLALPAKGHPSGPTGRMTVETPASGHRPPQDVLKERDLQLSAIIQAFDGFRLCEQQGFSRGVHERTIDPANRV
jgi:hypothetical protein